MTPIEKLVNGKIVKHKGISFLHVEKEIEDLDVPKKEKYIRENRVWLNREGLATEMPEFKHLSRQQIVYLDIETCGFQRIKPIIMVSLGRMNGKVEVEAAFARDPSEEEAVLGWTLDQLSKYEVICTYNGNAFDMDFLGSRLETKGLMPANGGDNGFKRYAKLKHRDLYPYARHKTTLQDYRQQTIEKIIFGSSRDGEVRGEEIPRIYERYLAGEENYGDVAKIINHNMKDVVGLIGILAFICKPKNSS